MAWPTPSPAAAQFDHISSPSLFSTPHNWSYVKVVFFTVPRPHGDPTLFEQIVKDPHALARHCQSPLAEERNRYLVHCAEVGLTLGMRRTIAAYLLVVTNYLRLGDRPGVPITAAEIETQATRWANRSSSRAQNARTREPYRRFIIYATQWLKFLGRWQPPIPAAHRYADRVAAFAEYMRQERGLSPNSVMCRIWIVQQFLDRLCHSRCLEEVTPAHVDDALLDKLRREKHARTSVRSYAYALRAFFRYAQTQGWCHRGLAETIQAPRVFSQDSLPSGPSWDDVQRMLATTEGDTAMAIRDRAVLLLLTVYGCRAGEAVGLCLEDLDWQRELIHFTRSKSYRKQTYPLSRPVGDAILRYLKEARPRSASRHVFLQLNAPFRPLTANALWWVVSRRLHGLGLSLRHYGPHALRHACASHLLEQGFTLKEIGDHLGHRDPETTRIYTKVDLIGLRQVAAFDIGGLL
jgi:site-specific recombinase XerD